MGKEDFSRQEEQVNLLVEKIRELVTGRLNTKEISTLIGKVIQMKESGEPDSSLKSFVATATGLEKNNPAVDSILAEIMEKPFQNSYFPFKNSVMESLKKNLERQ